MLDVILRTCDKVYSVHEEISAVEHRVSGPKITKLEIILRCANSLINSMNQVDSGLRLIVIDDHSSGASQIQKIIERCKHSTEFITLEGTGNAASIKACFNWAKDQGRDRFFFVEDDYLHDTSCISEMIYELDFFRMKLGQEVALFPSDNMDNYMVVERNKIPCFITLGSRRHWRTTNYSSLTFLCSREILERYWFLFERMTYSDLVPEDSGINVIWSGPLKNAGGAYLLSPIPALSLHLHFKDHLSPFINWKSWWDKNEYKI